MRGIGIENRGEGQRAIESALSATMISRGSGVGRGFVEADAMEQEVVTAAVATQIRTTSLHLNKAIVDHTKGGVAALAGRWVRGSAVEEEAVAVESRR